MVGLAADRENRRLGDGPGAGGRRAGHETPGGAGPGFREAARRRGRRDGKGRHPGAPRAGAAWRRDARGRLGRDVEGLGPENVADEDTGMVAAPGLGRAVPEGERRREREPCGPAVARPVRPVCDLHEASRVTGDHGSIKIYPRSRSSAINPPVRSGGLQSRSGRVGFAEARPSIGANSGGTGSPLPVRSRGGPGALVEDYQCHPAAESTSPVPTLSGVRAGRPIRVSW